MLHNKLAIASVSLGQHPAHTLPLKITAAAEAGIRGIEITHPDLDHYASALSLPILEAARNIRKLCAHQRLEIIAFASFQNFEGQNSPLPDRLQTAREWLAIADSLGALHLQVPSNFDRSASADRQVIASDLRQLCDLAKTLNPVVKIAYENLGWGTHCSLWQHALQIVQDVDRDNFGLCLDSFHFCVALSLKGSAQSATTSSKNQWRRWSKSYLLRSCSTSSCRMASCSTPLTLKPIPGTMQHSNPLTYGPMRQGLSLSKRSMVATCPYKRWPMHSWWILDIPDGFLWRPLTEG